MPANKSILWQIYARVYDKVFLHFHPYRDLLSHIIDAIDPKPGWRILDAGCGTGNFLNALADAEPEAEGIGVDYSSEMIKRAGQKCSDKGKLVLRMADLNKPLSFPEDYFDAVVCSNVLYAVEKPERLLQDFNRLLGEDGVLLLVTPPNKPCMGPVFLQHVLSLKAKAPYTWWLGLTLQIAKLLPFITVLLLVNRFIQREASFHFFRKEELGRLLLSCGFSVQVMEKDYGEQVWFVKAQKKKQEEIVVIKKEAPVWQKLL